MYRFRPSARNFRCPTTGLSESYVWMTDFYPYLHKILPQLGDIPADRKDRALATYRHSVEPYMKAVARPINQKEPLEILNLPFWKERWHTYEIWATVTTIKGLSHYCPRLEVIDGHIAIDGQSAGVIARLTATGKATSCVVVQMQTRFNRPRRKAIRPDLSICADETLRAASRLVVVEFKQRLLLSLAHVTDVGNAYIAGSPNASGVIFLNYDSNLTQEEYTKLPEGVFLFEHLRPDAEECEARFREKLLELLAEAGLHPVKPVTVLLDISSSMNDVYTDSSIQENLRILLGLPRVRVFRFSDCVVGSDLKPGEETRIVTRGSTSLATAIEELRAKGILQDDLVVVSDGAFETELRGQVRCFKPEELSNLIKWIREIQK
jgi:hypothetical protein